MKIREAFHNLINQIGDEAVLQSYYQLISVLNEKNEGELWNTLSGEEKAELLVLYGESFDEEKIVNHNVLMEKHLKW